MDIKPYKISLDIYIRKIITVNAKQLDTNSRIINITCTENGKKMVLNSSSTSAFVRYKKADGHNVLNEIEILSDGTVNLKLSQQMLAASGRNIVDIMLINGTNLSVETVEELLNSTNMDGISTLSTMSFYINTEGITIDSDEIESSYEYNALVDGLGKMLVVEKHMNELEETLTNNENQRIYEESVRQESETTRVIAEIQREKDFKEAINLCKSATDDANIATKLSNEATQKATEATDDANEATDRAVKAAEVCESVIDQSGIIMQTEKGHVNGVASLDGNALIYNEQLNTFFETELRETILSGEPFNIILGKIATYLHLINSMSQESNSSNENLPILLATSSSPVDGDAYGAYYNSGVTINPSMKSVNADTINANVQAKIGDFSLKSEIIGEEKRLVISLT